MYKLIGIIHVSKTNPETADSMEKIMDFINKYL